MRRWLLLTALVVTAGGAAVELGPRGLAERSPDSTSTAAEVSALPDDDAEGPTVGLRIDLHVDETGRGRERLLRLHVQDDDGGGPGYRVSYGDGQYGEVVLPQAACAPLPPEPPPPAVLDKVLELRHAYGRPGMYTVEVLVLSGRTCIGVADEEARLTEQVQVR